MIIQSIIAFTGAIAIWLTQTPRQNLAKYAPIVGLLGQPFWLYSTYIADQWGMFILSVFYTYAWLVGLYRYWIKENNA